MGPVGANADGPTLPRLRTKTSLIAGTGQGMGEIYPLLWCFPLDQGGKSATLTTLLTKSSGLHSKISRLSYPVPSISPDAGLALVQEEKICKSKKRISFCVSWVTHSDLSPFLSAL